MENLYHDARPGTAASGDNENDEAHEHKIYFSTDPGFSAAAENLVIAFK